MNGDNCWILLKMLTCSGGGRSSAAKLYLLWKSQSVKNISSMFVMQVRQRMCERLLTGLKKNITSVSKIANSGRYVFFGPDDVQILYNLKHISADVLFTGKRKESLYVLSASEACVEKTGKNASATLWYARLGHVGYQLLQKISMKKLLDAQGEDGGGTDGAGNGSEDGSGGLLIHPNNQPQQVYVHSRRKRPKLVDNVSNEHSCNANQTSTHVATQCLLTIFPIVQGIPHVSNVSIRDLEAYLETQFQ
ncbi:hypothetical protein Q3G72_028976 [Acer saccharum]|nr:hypothetical protein Q3G72_028976 [Acer saccharum]